MRNGMNQFTDSPRRLRVFLCHSSSDKASVRALSSGLTRPGFQLWLDEIDLLPGQYWRREIPKAVRESDVVLICLSASSVNKRGYVQKEIKFALDAADEQPEGSIFLIPVKLEDCTVPERLSDWQWVNLYDANGFDRLVSSLQTRAHELGITAEAGANKYPGVELEGVIGDPRRASQVTPGAHEKKAPNASSDSGKIEEHKPKRWLSARKVVGICAISACLIGVIWLVTRNRTSGTSTNSSVMHYNLGLTLANQQRNSEAETEFREALKINPNSAITRSALGLALGNQSKYAESESEFREAIRVDPNYAIAHHGLGLALNSQRRYVEAETEFKEALRLDPNYGEAHFNLGMTLVNQERYPEAQSQYEQSIKLAPNFPAPYNGLGLTLNAQQKYAEAAVAFKNALSRDPNFAPAHNGLGLTLVHQNNIPGAIVEFKEATRLLQNFGEAHYNLGVSLLSQGKNNEAETELRDAIRYDPNYSNNPTFHLSLGLSLGAQKKYGDAEDEFRQTTTLEPNNPIAHNALGLSLAFQKRDFEAEAAFREAERVDPNFAVARTNLNALHSGELLRKGTLWKTN
jgi:tetratricopeptide (TPR) repeat protein